MPTHSRYQIELTVWVAEGVASVVHRTVKAVDKSPKTVVVKTAEGNEHTMKVADLATMHGAKEELDGLRRVGSRGPLNSKLAQGDTLRPHGPPAIHETGHFYCSNRTFSLCGNTVVSRVDTS